MSGQLSQRNSDILVRELVRKRLVFVIEIVFWLLIFEGVLRKWLLLPLAKPLYFIRDPFCLYVYWIVFRSGFYPKGLLWNVTLIISALFFGLAFIQSTLGTMSLLAALYGWKQYVFFIPLAFIAGISVSGIDIKRIMRGALIVSIPMAVLVFCQYRSPVNSIINRMVDVESATAYGSLARTSGTFASSQGMEYFCQLAFCFILAISLLKEEVRPVNRITFLLAVIGTTVCLLLNGNRTALILALTSLAFSLVYRLFIAKAHLSYRLFIPELLVTGITLLYIFVFPDAFSAMQKRVAGSEGEMAGRTVQSIPQMMTSSLRTSFWGCGLGISNSGTRFLMMGVRPSRDASNANGDFELPKLLQEAGPLGFVYVAFRWTIAGYLLILSYRSSKRSQSPIPFILCSIPLPQLLIGAITFSSVSSCYVWLFVGFTIAASQNMGKRRDSPSYTEFGIAPKMN